MSGGQYFPSRSQAFDDATYAYDTGDAFQFGPQAAPQAPIYTPVSQATGLESYTAHDHSGLVDHNGLGAHQLPGDGAFGSLLDAMQSEIGGSQQPTKRKRDSLSNPDTPHDDQADEISPSHNPTKRSKHTPNIAPDLENTPSPARTLPNDESPQYPSPRPTPDARAIGVHSAAALFRQPSANGSKKYTRPPMSKLYISLKLRSEEFLRLQAAAKRYMLDPDHPERRDCVGNRGKGDSDMIKLRLFNCVKDFLIDGAGQEYFGSDVDSRPVPEGTNALEITDERPAERWIWPDDANKIIALVTPLLRRMVTNERQRQYAIETRKGDKDAKKNRPEEVQQVQAGAEHAGLGNGVYYAEGAPVSLDPAAPSGATQAALYLQTFDVELLSTLQTSEDSNFQSTTPRTHLSMAENLMRLKDVENCTNVVLIRASDKTKIDSQFWAPYVRTDVLFPLPYLELLDIINEQVRNVPSLTVALGDRVTGNNGITASLEGGAVQNSEMNGGEGSLGASPASEAPSVGDVNGSLGQTMSRQQQLAQAAAAAISGEAAGGAVNGGEGVNRVDGSGASGLELSGNNSVSRYTLSISVLGSAGRVPITNEQEWEAVKDDVRANRGWMEGILKVVVEVGI